MELDGPAAMCWPALLAYVKLRGHEGKVKRPNLRTLAVMWRIPVDAVERLEAAAIADRAISVVDGEWIIVNWAQYQDPSVERSKRYRAAKSRLSPSRHDTQRHATSRPDTNSLSRATRDIDRDKKHPPLLSPPSVGTEKKGVSNRSKLPDSWAPNDAHRDMARKLSLNLEAEFESFKDHAEANGRVLKSWDAGFRYWLRKAQQFHGQGNGVRSGKQNPSHIDPYSGKPWEEGQLDSAGTHRWSNGKWEPITKQQQALRMGSPESIRTILKSVI